MKSIKKLLASITTLALIIGMFAVVPASATQVSMKPVNPGVSTAVQTFDTLGNDYANRTNDATLLSAFSNTFGWTVSGNDVYLQRTTGKSGAQDDYAVRLISGPSGYTAATLTLNGWTEEVKSGTIVIDFDFRLNPVGSASVLKMLGIPVAENVISRAEKIYDTNHAVVSNQWVNMHYEYNVDNNTCILRIDGTEYWNGIAGTKTEKQNLSQLVFNPRFDSGASYYVTSYWARLDLDNFRIYKLEEVSIDKEYTISGFGKSFTDSIPCNAEKIMLTFGDDMGEITEEDVTFLVNDSQQTPSSFSYDSNTLSLGLPAGIKSGDIITVSVADAISENITVSARTNMVLTYDFDAMGDEYANRTNEADILSKFSKDFGWTVSGNNAYLQRVAGKSGNSDDYAVRMISYGTAGNTDAMLSFNDWTEEITSGTIVLDFDFQLNPVGTDTALKLRGIPFNASENIFAYTDKIYDTDFAVTNNQWVNMHYEYNVDNNTCSLTIDGTEYWKDQPGGTKDENQNLSQLIFNPRFGSGASYFTSNYYARFTLDNFTIGLYDSKPDVSVSDCALENDEFSFNVNTSNYTGKTNETMKVVVAFYDSERTLLSVIPFEDAAIPADVHSDNKSVTVPDKCSDIQVMIFESMDTLKPLTKATPYDID